MKMVNKTDLIKREDAIEAVVCHIWHAPDETKKLFNCEDYVRDIVEEALRELPSVEVVQGVGRYEKAMQILREMPKYLNGVKAKQIKEIPSEVVEVVKCKDCKHFTLNLVENVDGVPLIVAHEICSFWGDGCKTSQEGFCSFGEWKDED